MIMKSLVALGAAVLVAVGVPAGVARAQVGAPAAQQAANARVAEIQAINERVQALILGIIGDPNFASAQSPEQMAAAVRKLRPQITATRTELLSIAADLESRPRLAPWMGGDVAQSMTDEVAATARMMDGLLGNLDALVTAYDAGDRSKLGQLAQTLAGGIVGMVDSQVTSLRGRAAVLPPDGSAAHQLHALACFYEGLNGFNRAYFGMSNRRDAYAAIMTATDCMDRSLGQARVALREEKVLEGGRMGAPFDEYVEIRGAMQDRIAEAIEDLRALGEGVSDGQSLERLADGFQPKIIDFEQDLTRLNGREVDLLPRLGG